MKAKDFKMRITVKKEGENYTVWDDAGIKIFDLNPKEDEAHHLYFDVRHKQACEGDMQPDTGSKLNLADVSGSASASSTDPQIDYHLRRVKAVNHYIKDRGNLTARVFLRATGAVNNADGTFTIQEQDIKEWFESGSHLTVFTEYDTM